MFDGFFTRIRTIMGVGASHGKRGFPRDEQGIAIPIWGDLPAVEVPRVDAGSEDHGSPVSSVTPISFAGGKSNG